MSENSHKILNSRRLPARLTAQEVAILLAFVIDDISILARHRILKPLNEYGTNTVKFYATVEVLALAENPAGLARATRAVYEAHRAKAQRKGGAA